LVRFYLGSTAVILFEKDKIEWGQRFKAESVVVMGERMGHTI
ncbi:phosphatidylserine decarboxylase, partial [Acinetobacter baumannii]